MNVRQLINQLRRFPMDSEVGIQDHDANEYELSAKIDGVYPFDPSTSMMLERCTPESVAWADNVRVVIRAG